MRTSVLAASLIVFIFGCIRAIPAGRESLDSLGCPIAPPTAFQKVGFSLSVAQAQVGGTSFSGVQTQLTPDIIPLVSQAIADEQVLSYLNCRVRNSYAPHIAHWYTLLDAFMRTKPTADQLAQWQKDNPIPPAPSHPGFSVIMRADGYIFGTGSLFGTIRASSSTAQFTIDGDMIVDMRLDEQFPNQAITLSPGVHTLEIRVDIRGTQRFVDANCVTQFEVTGPAAYSPRIEFKPAPGSSRHVLVDKCSFRKVRA